jgi:hypothetical protein
MTSFIAANTACSSDFAFPACLVRLRSANVARSPFNADRIPLADQARGDLERNFLAVFAMRNPDL